MIICTRAVFFGVLCFLPAVQCDAEIPLDDAGRIAVFGDFRTRLERDWDSRREDGSERDDRSRLRIRARLGTNIHIKEDLLLQLRVATGDKDSQQSTNITVHDFNGNGTGDKNINVDLAWVFLELKSWSPGCSWSTPYASGIRAIPARKTATVSESIIPCLSSA